MSKAVSKKPSVASLINSITKEIDKGKINLKSALEKQKTSSYWNIGRLISKHLSFYSKKADYGERLFITLSQKLNIGIRSLYFSVQFYSFYPSIKAISDYLTWSHFKILLTIKSEDERKKYLDILLKRKLSIRDFFNLVKKDNNIIISPKGNKLLRISSSPYIYSLKQKNNKTFLDLGFRIYSDLFIDKLDSFSINDFISSSKLNDKYNFKKASGKVSDLYTYKAFVTKIIDGDTITADIDLGFNTIINETLRFRGINAFELSTNAGKKAKDFVSSKLQNLDFIVIKTYRRDKYSRYLADIFYSDKISDMDAIIKKGNFLNQELLDNNLAFKYYVY